MAWKWHLTTMPELVDGSSSFVFNIWCYFVPLSIDFLLTKIIVWNCQGTALKEFNRILQFLLSIHNPSILGLVETKVSGSNANDICNRIGFDHCVKVEALGFSGGIWLFSHKEINVTIIKTHPQFIHSRVVLRDGDSCLLSVVYGNPNYQLRKFLW